MPTVEDTHRYKKDPRDMNALKYSSYLIAKKILEYMAPELAKAQKWDKLKSLFETSCDKCFLNRICGTHGNPGAVCEDIKEAIERGLIKCPQVNCLSPECKENPECGGTGRIKAEWAKGAERGSN